MTIRTTTPRELYNAAQSGKPIELIDVRTPAEFAEIHVDFARNVPLDQIDATRVVADRQETDGALYVICKTGGRGKMACEKLYAAGHPNVVNVEGGTQAWDLAGLPVIRGTKTMSLERQVRIAAGSLVVLGSLLGYFAHPAWYALPGFVGAGLVVAGITDSCAMGMLLAKMPWNQAPGRAAASTSDGAGAVSSGLPRRG